MAVANVEAAGTCALIRQPPAVLRMAIKAEKECSEHTKVVEARQAPVAVGWRKCGRVNHSSESCADFVELNKCFALMRGGT